MHAIAPDGCTDTVRESALKADSGRKISYGTGDSNLRQYSALAFQSDALPTELFPPVSLEYVSLQTFRTYNEQQTAFMYHNSSQILTSAMSPREQPTDAGQKQDQLQKQRITVHHRVPLLHPESVGAVGGSEHLHSPPLRCVPCWKICEKQT